jgi:hypothetical protein
MENGYKGNEDSERRRRDRLLGNARPDFRQDAEKHRAAQPMHAAVHDRHHMVRSATPSNVNEAASAMHSKESPSPERKPGRYSTTR